MQIPLSLIFFLFGLGCLGMGIFIGMLIGTSISDKKAISYDIYVPKIPKSFIEVDYYK